MKHCGICGTRIRNHRRYCSQICNGKSKAKPVNIQLLQNLVSEGAPAGSMAVQLGINVGTLRIRLRQYGLYRTWAGHRVKCQEVA